MSNISSLSKLSKEQLIDWFINSAEPQVMLSCLVNKLEKNGASSNVLDEAKNLITEISTMNFRQRKKFKPIIEEEIVEEPEEEREFDFSGKVNKNYLSALNSKEKISKVLRKLEDSKVDDIVEYIFNVLIKNKANIKDKQEVFKVNREFIYDNKNVIKALYKYVDDDHKRKSKLKEMVDTISKKESSFGFGSPQSNRQVRKRRSKARLAKSGAKMGSKKLKRRRSKKNRMSSSFGDEIYGLQNGPNWEGVFPMELNVEGTIPTLLFGKSKKGSKRKSKGRKGSKKGSKGRKVSKGRGSRKGSKKGSKKGRKRSKGLMFGAPFAPRSKTILRRA
jgi:hypothetical protein